MSRRPPRTLSEWPDRSSVGSLRAILVVACLFALVACGSTLTSGSDKASPVAASIAAPTAESTPGSTPDRSADVHAGDLEGLVVLTDGKLSIGSPDGTLVDVHGPAMTGFSTTRGRLIVQTAGPKFAAADVDLANASPLTWRVVELPALAGRQMLSSVILSPRGDKVAVAVAEPGRPLTFDIDVMDLVGGAPRISSIGRESNGPAVWIDDSNLLLEVVPIPGGTRFLRLDLATGRVDPVAADGFGPAISGDGSLLAVASTDGSVVAVAAAGWLTGHPPDEGSLVDASGSVFELAIDATGRRIAIGYADAAGDPESLSVFVRDGGAWRGHAVSISLAPGKPTMLGWLN
jgi:hypothetical protein